MCKKYALDMELTYPQLILYRFLSRSSKTPCRQLSPFVKVTKMEP